MRTLDALGELCRWYHAQCDGNWEHEYGIQIETLDNPGWSVRVDLQDTLLEHVPFPRVQDGEADDAADASWIDCEKQGPRFRGMGDPGRLQEIVDRFLQWAKEQPDWLAVPDVAELGARRDDELWALLGRDRV